MKYDWLSSYRIGDGLRTSLFCAAIAKSYFPTALFAAFDKRATFGKSMGMTQASKNNPNLPKSSEKFIPSLIFPPTTQSNMAPL